jgi:hypothetical protein
VAEQTLRTMGVPPDMDMKPPSVLTAAAAAAAENEDVEQH